MNINENKLIIEDYLNIDYEMANKLLIERLDIDILEINNSEINLDTISNIIDNTSIKTLILNNSEILHENNNLINIDHLVINNVTCNNFEVFMKFTSITKLTISNTTKEFNCYYLRILNNLGELSLINVSAIHLSSLGYLKKLSHLHLTNVPINNWMFTTKLLNLKTLYLFDDYDLSEIPRLLFEIKKDNN